MNALSLFPLNLTVSELHRCLFAVAIGTPHGAFSQFSQYKRPTSVATHKQGNGHLTAFFGFEVVCFQDDNIRLSTVNTGSLGKPLPVFLAVFRSPIVLPFPTRQESEG